MPDSPLSVKWLTDREKAIAIKRVAKDQQGVKNSMSSSTNDRTCANLYFSAEFKWDQVSVSRRISIQITNKVDCRFARP